MAYQANVPSSCEMGPHIGPSHERSTLDEESALYRRHGQVFAPLDTVGFRAH